MTVTDLRDAAAPPAFPPLFTGMAVSGAVDPFDKARAQAIMGCDAGLVVHRITDGALHAAIVFAPETPLRQAIAVVMACAVGVQNALGALAPPEVGVHLTWEGGLLVNGAGCGRLRVVAGGTDPEAEVPWIVVGLEVPLAVPPGTDPGADPTRTTLQEEGCGDIAPVTLLEAWVRHSLVWINRMLEEGNRPLHAEWRGLAHGLGEEVALTLRGQRHAGTFVGVDEDFGMLLRAGDETRVLPLTDCLEDAP